MAESGLSLSRSERVRRRSDFDRVHRSGTKVSGRFVLVLGRRRDSGRARLGMAASRKLGGAVVRNRAKRLIRELFRRCKPTVAVDLVVIPRSELLVAEFSLLEQDFRSTVGRCLSRELRPRVEPEACQVRRVEGPGRV